MELTYTYTSIYNSINVKLVCKAYKVSIAVYNMWTFSKGTCEEKSIRDKLILSQLHNYDN